MVELVVVIAIAGIVAAVAVPRLVARGGFDSRAFYDNTQSLVRHAQKVAIARRATGAPIWVCIVAPQLPTYPNITVRAGTTSGCATPLTDPVTGGNMIYMAPAGVTPSPLGSFSFDGLGQPSAAVAIAISSTIAGDPARQINVAAGTGYVTHTP